MDAALRNRIRARAAFRCEYRRLPQRFSDLRFHVEHVILRQHGGTEIEDNLALACPACNWLKGPNLTGIEPETKTITPLFHPRRDAWTEHFSFAGARIVGVTPAGRTTVALLDMNDPERLRVRSLLLEIGEVS